MAKIKVGDYVESKHGMKGQVVAIDSKYVFIPAPKNSVEYRFSDKIGFPIKDVDVHKPFKRFEVLWYENEEVYTIEFATRKEALKYYEQHQHDEGRYGWWVTKRNLNWEVVEDIIY